MAQATLVPEKGTEERKKVTALEYIREELEKECPLWDNEFPCNMQRKEKNIFVELLEAIDLFKYKTNSKYDLGKNEYCTVYDDEDLLKGSGGCYVFVETTVRPKLRQAVKILEETEKYG